MEHYGIVSLLPPVIAVVLAVKTKNVISSLFWAGLIGVFVLCGYNPIQVLPTYIKDSPAGAQDKKSTDSAASHSQRQGRSSRIKTNSPAIAVFPPNPPPEYRP